MTAPTETFDFHSDPGHGWMAVDVKLLQDMGIADKISECSYVSRDGRTAFIEEDGDLGTFVMAYKAKHGVYPRLLELNSVNGDSFIRGLRRFTDVYRRITPNPTKG